MPVAVPVRNISRNKVIISQGKGESIEWGHAGCDDGSDVQEVPEELWMGNKLRKAVTNGILVEDTPEGMQTAQQRQQTSREAKAADRQSEVDAALKAGTGTDSIVISAEDAQKQFDAMAKQRGNTDVLDQITTAPPSPPQQSTAMDAVNSL